jgi:hypothetical protein
VTPSHTIQRALAWCGPVMIALFIVGFWGISGFVPPPSPHASTRQIAAMFAHDTGLIRLGLWISTFAAALIVPWAVSVGSALRRTERGLAPLGHAQAALGALLAIEFIVPLMLWQGAAFRPLSDPHITQRFNDLAWLILVGVVSTAVVQAGMIGAAILADRRPDPIFPRWSGYFNLWCGLAFVPAGLCPFFKHGAFAWNGLLTFWLGLVSFAAWMLVLTALVLRASYRQERARDSSPGGGDVTTEAPPDEVLMRG